MASGIRGCFTLGGFLVELTPDGSTPRFASRVLLFFGLDARDLLLCRGRSWRFLAFGLRPCSLDASCFLTSSGLLTLRLPLCCSRYLDTSRFLTSCRQTFRLQLCRSPSRGFDARRCLLTSGLLSLRLQSCCRQLLGLQSCCRQLLGLLACCRQLLGLLAASLQSRSLGTCRFFTTIGLPFRGLNPRRLQLIRPFGQFSGSLSNVLADSLPC